MKKVDVLALTNTGPAWDVVVEANGEQFIVRVSAPDAVAASLAASYALQSRRGLVGFAVSTKRVDWEAVVDAVERSWSDFEGRDAMPDGETR